MQSAELWDLRSAILYDLVYADFKSDTADKWHPFILPQGKSYMVPSLRDSKALSEREGGTALAVTGGCF